MPQLCCGGLDYHAKEPTATLAPEMPLLPGISHMVAQLIGESQTSLLLGGRATVLPYRRPKSGVSKNMDRVRKSKLSAGQGPQHHPLFPPGGGGRALPPFSVKAHEDFGEIPAKPAHCIGLSTPESPGSERGLDREVIPFKEDAMPTFPVLE